MGSQSLRQLLADRVRHHKVKFTWDPDYVDAKKKSTSARERRPMNERRNENVMGEDAMMYENFAAIMNDLPIDENLETEIEQHPENDLALENTKLAVETFVHENEEIVDLPYVQPYIMPTVEIMSVLAYSMSWCFALQLLLRLNLLISAPWKKRRCMKMVTLEIGFCLLPANCRTNMEIIMFFYLMQKHLKQASTSNNFLAVVCTVNLRHFFHILNPALCFASPTDFTWQRGDVSMITWQNMRVCEVWSVREITWHNFFSTDRLNTNRYW